MLIYFNIKLEQLKRKTPKTVCQSYCTSSFYPAIQRHIVTTLVTYSNKHTSQCQGISHHHLHHIKTHRYHHQHHPNTRIMKQSFPLLSHTHIYKQPSLKHSSNHTCKHSPPHTLMLCMASHSWLSEATVWVKPRVSYTWL